MGTNCVNTLVNVNNDEIEYEALFLFFSFFFFSVKQVHILTISYVDFCALVWFIYFRWLTCATTVVRLYISTFRPVAVSNPSLLIQHRAALISCAPELLLYIQHNISFSQRFHYHVLSISIFFYHAHIMAEKIRLVCIYSRIPYNKVTRSDAHNRDITIVEKCITLYWCSFYIIHIYIYIYLALFHFVTARCIVSLHFIQFCSVQNLKKKIK